MWGGGLGEGDGGEVCPLACYVEHWQQGGDQVEVRPELRDACSAQQHSEGALLCAGASICCPLPDSGSAPISPSVATDPDTKCFSRQSSCASATQPREQLSQEDKTDGWMSGLLQSDILDFFFFPFLE